MTVPLSPHPGGLHMANAQDAEAVMRKMAFERRMMETTPRSGPAPSAWSLINLFLLQSLLSSGSLKWVVQNTSHGAGPWELTAECGASNLAATACERTGGHSSNDCQYFKNTAACSGEEWPNGQTNPSWEPSWASYRTL